MAHQSTPEGTMPSVIQGPRLDLVLFSGALLDACLANDRARVRELAAFTVPDEFPGRYEWIELRRDQVRADPTWAPWSLRALVLREEQEMVGFTNFHGPPGVNSTGDSSAVEVGYTVFPAFRGRGYATETCRLMLEWAQREHGIRHFISSIEPSNAPSLRVIEKLGFVPMGLMLDGEAIFELYVP
jgi:RimJ/RimL family protein N-acetyltransferase